LGRGGPVYGQALGDPAVPGAGQVVHLDLAAAERPTALPCFGGRTLPLWTFSDETWLPVVRMPLGAKLEVDFANRLPRSGDHATIHWHGIRLPNDQDGVPYLIQEPVLPGGSYRYGFTPPDTGTFFFHTHCNTAEHLGRGLHAVLIVEGDTTEPYDADEIVLIRDWRVDLEAGAFLPFTTSRGAGRAGTFGTLRTVNGAVEPEIMVPAGGDCRLRLINVDPTRTVEIGIEGADAAIIAIDGIGVPPFPLGRWDLGSAMRIDVVVRTGSDGSVARLIDYRPDEPLPLATFRSTGRPRRSGSFAPAPLRAAVIPEPDLGSAETLTFAFNAARDVAAAPPGVPTELYLGPTCLSANGFWTINAAGWPGPGNDLVPAPLAEMRLGRSYRLVLRNETQFVHPIHIHGHSFSFLSSDMRSLPSHHADTFLLLSQETAELALVADNPGKWMIHCHIAEHQEAGMMGYFTVT
jgi:FtsP/CotA-like multicopper oxidase with cupredoxin domain